MANISLRDVPDELYEQIKEIAERERRSVNQQILVLLERSMLLQRRPSPELWEQIDQTRKAIEARVGILPNSPEMIAEDRWSR